ncbi:chaplin [Streptomyces sp. NBC_00124]|uniref:chaplin family protein n=1 Tax=Streptomyces sp. NBC_00124 TaxID=2975662 RepID=UPI00224F4B71|nr:chaplin family protein [Streptomyces sp. NBC_00124]MCX5364029.1 chaplin [Streptomyces sp. NBC_00124]
MRVIARTLTTAAVAATAVLAASTAQATPYPAVTSALSFPCSPAEDVCAVEYVENMPGVGTGNVIQTPVDIDINVRP